MTITSRIWDVSRRKVSVFFAFLLLSSLAAGLLGPLAKAAPAYTASWVNRSTIAVASDDGKTFELTDAKWDDNWSYEGKADDICDVTLDGFGSNQIVGLTDRDGNPRKWDANASKGTLHIERKIDTSCKEISGSPFQVSIASPENATIAFAWVDSGKLQRINDPSTWSFVAAPAPSGQSTETLWFVRESESSATSCQDMIEVTADKQTMKLYEQDEGAGSGDAKSPIDSSCHLVHTLTSMTISSRDASGAVPSNYALTLSTENSDLASGTGTDLAGGAAKSKGCSAISINPLNWILCPIINLATSAAQRFDKALNQTLANNATQFDETDENGGQQMFVAWGYIRNIAMVVFVGVLLIIIISQAIGMGPFDAYMIRKTLPRILLAAILATLSWYLCKLFINFSNDMGYGIKGLLYAPFGGTTNVESAIHVDGSIISGIGVDGALAFGALVLFSVVDIGVILLTAAIVLMTTFVGFAVIVARNIAIVGLVITAPLAAVFYVLPNTKKWADFWWDAFSKGLLMFPIIIGVIALGRVFAYITLYGAKPYQGDIPLQNTAGDLVKLMIALVAYFGPYFIIPKTFTLAGGLVARIAGVANDRSKGLFDRARKSRSEKMHALHERSGRNKRYSDRNRLTRFGNKLAGWGADPMNSYRITAGTSSNSLLRRLPGSERGRGLAAELTQKAALQSQDLAKWLSQAGFNQEALTAIIQNAQANKGRINESELHHTIQEWRRTGNTQEKAAALQLEHYAPFLGDIWRSEEYGRASAVMAAGLAKGSQGFLNSADPAEIANISNYLNTQAPGLGDTFKTQAGLFNAQGGGMTKVGYSEQVDANGNYVVGGVNARAVHFMRLSVQDLSGAKASQLKLRFINEATPDQDAIIRILGADTSRGEVSFTDAATGEVAKVDQAKQQAVLDNIVQAAYGYNTPAETAAVLRKQLSRLESDLPNMRERIERARQRVTREGIDPAQQGLMGQPPAAPGPFDDNH